MDCLISVKQKNFLEKLVPNCVVFCNKFIEWKIDNISYLKKKDYFKIMGNLEKIGCYIPISISMDRYEYNLIESHGSLKIYNQKNLYKKTTMKIISIDNILILDMDNVSIENLKKTLSEAKKFNFKIYKTQGGYHVYCINRYFNHKDYNTLQFMKDLGCDDMYIHFTRYIGFVTRASKKYTNEEFIEKFEMDIINIDETTNEDQKTICKILKMKDILICIENI